MIIDEQLRKNPEETTEQYFYRLCKLKYEKKLTWDKVTEIYNKECNLQTTVSGNASRWYRLCRKPKDALISKSETKLNDLLTEIRKERVKLTDERTQNSAIIRRLSREETIKEIGAEAASTIAQQIPLVFKTPFLIEDKGYQAILELSDWHYGIEIENAYNKYNPDIAKQRLNTLVNKVVDKLIKHNVNKLYVVNLSDLISGRIHLPLRINSRFDVITQIMNVSEILANVLSTLSEYVAIEYYDCNDNHSRLEPSKGDSLDLETLTRITHWFLKERLKGNPNITINENEWGQDIITFKVYGHNVAGVHGNNDSPSKVLDNITLMTRQSYDLCCTAHRHHFAADEKNCCVIVSNGSLMGTDDYAEKLRLSAYPSQNLIICSESNACECIYRLVL